MSDSASLMIKSDRLYDILKRFALVVLPALGTLYFALSQIWGLPNGEEIVGTIVAIDAFLGITLGVSSSVYKSSDERFDGHINVVETGDKVLFTLNLEEDPYELADRDELLFRVKTTSDDI